MLNETCAACVGYTDVTLHAYYITKLRACEARDLRLDGEGAGRRAYVSKCRPLPAPIHFEPNCGGWMEIG